MSKSPQDVYARYLLSSRGYPLWIPEPSHQLLQCRPDGLRIGDVGVVVPEDGGFEVFFNICLPREHSFHRASGVPDGHKHVDLRDEDIRIIPNIENPGRIISTSSVTKIRTVEPPRDTSGARLDRLGYEFDLSSSGGALLILPEGAIRYDLQNRQLFFDEATRHGINWYRFAEEQLGRMITHDSLYLITGFYKASSWSLAAFENVAGSGNFSAQFKMAQVGGGDLAGTYTWETTRAMDWRVGPVENYGIPNQSVFIRGFKIALREDFLGQKRVEVKADAPSTRSGYETFSRVVKQGSRISKFWKGISGGGHRETNAQNDLITGSTTDQASGDSPTGGASNVSGKQVVIQHMPELPQNFHPSDIINQYLFEKEASANVAVTHDDDWITILEKGQLRPEELLQASSSRMEATISNIFHIASREGVVFLQQKGCSGADATNDPSEGGTENECEAILKGEPIITPGTSIGYQATDILSEKHCGDEALPTDTSQGDDLIAVVLPGSDRILKLFSDDIDPDFPVEEDPPPKYRLEGPVRRIMDAEKKSHLFPETLHGVHWMLLPHNPRTSKRLLRFDIILPVDRICYQHSNNVRERLTNESFDEPATDEHVAKMTITFEQRPFKWTIDVDNPKGIRCRDVFEAIYNSFNQHLTIGEVWCVPDRKACEEAFYLRSTVLDSPRTERSLGWKRVDVLLHHTIFHGLTKNSEGDWILNLGAPLPVSEIARPLPLPPQVLTFTGQESIQKVYGYITQCITTSPENIPRGLGFPIPSRGRALSWTHSRHGSSSTEGSTESSVSHASYSDPCPTMSVPRSRPTRHPLGPRVRPSPIP